MAIATRVTGAAQLRELEARLLAAGQTLDRATVKRLKPIPAKVAKLVRAEAPTHLPKRHGYAALFARSIRYRSSVTSRGMTMTVWAEGKKERRALPVINRGQLRHPLFGNRSHWYATKVKPGVVNDGLNKAEPLVIEAVEKARDDVADSITR